MAIHLKTHKLQMIYCFCVSSVTQSCPVVCDPIDYNLPGSSVHGISQARILEWVAISFSRLLLLSCFSHVRLCLTPQMAAHQAIPSLGSSRQEHWSGLPFPSPMHESEVTQSCLTLRNSMDCSLPGSSIHGIFPARVLEWGAIAFSVPSLELV